MTYQLADGWSSVNFVRPAHALVALHGADVVPVSVLGLSAGNATKGHRFEAPVDPVVIADADSYAETLKRDGAVIASFAERRAEIARQLTAAAAKAGGLKPIEDEALLDEVTALVERPNVLVGQFEAGIPGRAAGMPDPDHEGQPEVLPAARRRGQADQQVPGGQQHQPGRRFAP